MVFEKLLKTQLKNEKKKTKLLRELLDNIEESADEKVKNLISEYKSDEEKRLRYIPFNPSNMKVEYFVSNEFNRNDIFIKLKDDSSSGIPHIMDFESKKDAQKVADYLNGGLIKMTGSYLTSENGPIEL